ncbi:hypothetical protein DPEC_G00320690 [Dallia pectoralis]|uniref:Uncharacterized protein n=1 Tax=Dallia pectoralis TaxID=75939 RepID=A0ACC2F9Z1_DALPE|nr:hypothetical protein DPEC_G00320690 [Dallia pectoralis]
MCTHSQNSRNGYGKHIFMIAVGHTFSSQQVGMSRRETGHRHKPPIWFLRRNDGGRKEVGNWPASHCGPGGKVLLKYKHRSGIRLADPTTHSGLGSIAVISGSTLTPPFFNP